MRFGFECFRDFKFFWEGFLVFRLDVGIVFIFILVFDEYYGYGSRIVFNNGIEVYCVEKV